MRFMMLMIPAVYKQANPPAAPDAKAIERMMKYNEELAKAGALLALDGLHPPTSAVRVSYGGGKPTVTDGPFSEAREVVGGYWMIQVKSKAEATEWARRIPAAEGDVVEIRQVFEISDFPAEVQQSAESKTVRNAIQK
jgi:hypothetical protein